MKLPLYPAEKALLRKSKIKMTDIDSFNALELSKILDCPIERAKELSALTVFQKIPSVGIKFAEDLIFIGIYSMEDLKGKNPADLCDLYEIKKGYWTDPCVEDQFRLVVYAAESNDLTKKWWDFTDERKAYREKYGYPENRPKKAWFEILKK